jgi:hypothetical protein
MYYYEKADPRAFNMAGRFALNNWISPKIVVVEEPVSTTDAAGKAIRPLLAPSRRHTMLHTPWETRVVMDIPKIFADNEELIQSAVYPLRHPGIKAQPVITVSRPSTYWLKQNLSGKWAHLKMQTM